jgi:serine/threonine protein kinase/Flp pilus assembly protein TadD
VAEPDDESRLEEAVAQWWDRRRRGEEDATQAVLRAYPDLAATLAGTLDELSRSERALDLVAGVDASTPFDDFRIVRELGRGGMGVVFEAEQRSMRRVVALKVLHPAVVLEPQAVERFRREAQAAGRIHHTNLVPVYAMGEDRGRWFYAMELVRGRTLAEVIRDLRDLRAGPPGANTPAFATGGTSGAPSARDFYARAALAFAGVADALRTAHQAGVVHRDVKPSNLILADDGTVKLTDFGLARAGDRSSSITVTGATLGTPAYMSPEQVKGPPHPIDGRTDVWSLGATLYELLTLRPPFTGDTSQLFHAILSKEPPPPRSLNRRIPVALEAIVQKALEKDLDRRYASVADLGQDLSAFALGERIRAQRMGPLRRAWRRVRRRPGLSAVSAGLAAAVVVAAFMGLQAGREGDARRLAQYDLLLRQAAEAAPRVESAAGRSGREEALRLYEEAIRVDPDRPDAYVARALDEGRAPEDRLRDVDAAADRGLPAVPVARLRAYVRAETGTNAGADAAPPAPPADDADPLSQLLAGSLALERRDWEEAERRFTGVLSARPSPLVSHLAHLRRITVRMQTSRFTEALDDLHALQALEGESLFRAFTEAWLWRRLGKEKEAESLFARLLDQASASQASIAALVHYAGTADRDWHLRTTERGIAQFPASADLWEAHALALERSGRPADALAAWDRVAVTRPDDPEMIVCRAQSLANLGRREEALSESARAAAADPRNCRVLVDRADVCRRFDRIDEGIAAATAALAVDPTSVPAMRLLGVFALAQGRLADADAWFAGALRLKPRSPNVLSDLGRLRHTQHDLAGALDAFDRSIAFGPDDPDTHVLRGRILRDLHRDADAEQAFLRALALKPDFEPALYRLGTLLLETGRRDAAVSRLRAAVRANPKHAQAWLNLGNALRAHPILDAAGAIEAYETARKVEPALWEATANLGALWIEAGRSAEALPVLEACLATGGKDAVEDPDLRFNLGVALFELNRLDEALARFDETLRIAPTYVPAHVQIAQVHLKAKRPAQAVPALEAAVQASREDPRLHHYLGLARWKSGDLRGAETALHRAVDLNPKDAGSRGLWSAILHDLGEDVASAREAENARLLQPDLYQRWRDAAVSQVDLHKDGAAADLLVEAADRFLGDVHAQCMASWMLTTATDATVHAPEKAALYARRAIALDPKSSDAHQALGVALYRQQRYSEAIRHLEESRTLGPADPQSSFFLAMALHALGKPAEAKVAFDRAVAARTHDPKDPGDVESTRFEAEARSVLASR